MKYQAPLRFAKWMTENTHIDKNLGHTYRYHSRSDAHSKALCKFIAEDLIDASSVMAQHAQEGKIVYAINCRYKWPSSAKAKTIDLAIGIADQSLLELGPDEVIAHGVPKRVLLSCEAKTCMTEHGKSKPRIYDELSSSHTIVHAGDKEALAAGIAVVNIADQFASPLRQMKGQPLMFKQHTQPKAAEQMVEHLRGLPIRQKIEEEGFDGYSTIVISCDNQGPATLWTELPAPQDGDMDHYDSFVEKLAREYDERFSDLS